MGQLYGKNCHNKTLMVKCKRVFTVCTPCSHLSDYFYSNVGVRQGENISPILFAVFLNDLIEFILKENDGLSYISDTIHLDCDNKDIYVYLRLYLLLYADDTVVLAESK